MIKLQYNPTSLQDSIMCHIAQITKNYKKNITDKNKNGEMNVLQAMISMIS